MGASGRRKLIVLLLICAAAAATTYKIYHSKTADTLNADDIKFVNVYAEMSVAREMAGRDSLLLDSLYSTVYNRYDVDSTWLLKYPSTFSNDAARQKRIWDYIVAKLDSLKTAPDSLQFQ